MKDQDKITEILRAKSALQLMSIVDDMIELFAIRTGVAKETVSFNLKSRLIAILKEEYAGDSLATRQLVKYTEQTLEKLKKEMNNELTNTKND